MKKKFVNPTKVITGIHTRWSYANVWTPKAINGSTPKYSVSLIILKSDTVTIQKVKAARYRPLVYICSPYSGDIADNARNTKTLSGKNFFIREFDL